MAMLKKEWAAKNKDKVNAYSAKRRHSKTEEQKLKDKEYQQAYHATHKEEHNQRSKEYYHQNKNKAKEYREANRETINENKRNYENHKRKTDSVYYIKQKARNVIYKSFARKGFHKIALAEEITGLSGKDLCNYLLNTFFENYGYEWNGVEEVHIDHIIPLSTASTEEEVRKLCHFSNLQLLKAFDNLSKHDRKDFKL